METKNTKLISIKGQAVHYREFGGSDRKLIVAYCDAMCYNLTMYADNAYIKNNCTGQIVRVRKTKKGELVYVDFNNKIIGNLTKKMLDVYYLKGIIERIEKGEEVRDYKGAILNKWKKEKMQLMWVMKHMLYSIPDLHKEWSDLMFRKEWRKEKGGKDGLYLDKVEKDFWDTQKDDNDTKKRMRTISMYHC